MEFLFVEWLGKPVWMWLGFHVLVGILLAFDLGILHKGAKEIGIRESFILSAFYISLGVAFSFFVAHQLGSQAAKEYLTGFVIEKSLSMDNVFVIAMIFGYLAIPRAYQYRVLFWGILAVILLRGIMIGVGAALVAQYAWIMWIFAAFLIITGVKMIMVADKEYDVGSNPLLRFMRKNFRVTDKLHGQSFTVRLPDPKTGKRVMFITPLFLALVLVNVADVIFAVDSVPAIFAILGLRALYFALAAMIDRFRYLKYALAVVLIFIGGKIIIADAMGLAKVPAMLSLSVTLGILAIGIIYSLWRTRADGPTPASGVS